jgi:hypothetical protein
LREDDLKFIADECCDTGIVRRFNKSAVVGDKTVAEENLSSVVGEIGGWKGKLVRI